MVPGPQIHRRIQGPRLIYLSVLQQHNRSPASDASLLFVSPVNDKTIEQIRLVASSCRQTKTRGGTRPQFVKKHNSDQNMNKNAGWILASKNISTRLERTVLQLIQGKKCLQNKGEFQNVVVFRFKFILLLLCYNKLGMYANNP